MSWLQFSTHISTIKFSYHFSKQFSLGGKMFINIIATTATSTILLTLGGGRRRFAMKLFGISLLMLTFVVIAGCGRTSRLGQPQYMPSNWLTLRSNAWQVQELPDAYQKELSDLQIMLFKERQGQYYNCHGTYSPEVQNEIDATTSRLDQAYLNLQYSSKVILANLTPELNGLAETDAQRKAAIAVVNNQNKRMVKDDINRALLLDKPSTLSPYPVSGD